MVSRTNNSGCDETQIRCIKCKKLLARPNADTQGIEIKCRRCGTLNTFLEDSEHQIIITDTQGRVLFANDAVIRETQYQIEEIIGNTPALWGKQMSKSFYENMWHQLLTDKKTFVDTIVNKRKNGETYSVHMRVSPILNAAGEVEFFVAIETSL